MRAKEGEEVGRMYYERNGWRSHGQPRFYDSPEALILAFGGALARAVGLKKPRGSKVGQGGTKAPLKKVAATSAGKRVKKVA